MADLTAAVAPLRISLAGGGTDLPSYADRFGGDVLSFAIDRCAAVVRFPREFGRQVAGWLSVPDPATGSHAVLDNEIAAAVLRDADTSSGCQIVSAGDAPGGTGLGSSAAFAVAMVAASRPVGRFEPRAVAEEAFRVETQTLGRPVGRHDHYMAAMGGLRHLRFGDGGVAAGPVPVPPDLDRFIGERLLLFFTGRTRDAGAMLTGQHCRTLAGDPRTIELLHGIHRLVPPMREALAASRFDDIGPILGEHWELKRRLSPGITDERIEDHYRSARRAGASGGKLLGAGGGGFLLLAGEDGREAEVRQAMEARGLRELTFRYRERGATTAALAL
ncbi:hypothetical protein OHV13_34035 [Kitasatospora purpeofusca]|uniref:GHMP family kinase ATP-binding protein n=1 Tax=Kitasatospora purpeofusca TaxID=67352 RepID=UPI003248275F